MHFNLDIGMESSEEEVYGRLVGGRVEVSFVRGNDDGGGGGLGIFQGCNWEWARLKI